VASYNHSSTEFALAGAVVDEKIKKKLDLRLTRIKKKYFGDGKVVLHYREIARKMEPFEALKDEETEIGFWAEILSLLNNPKINYVFTIVDKKKAREKGWHDKTIAERSYKVAIRLFAQKLKKEKQSGRIITESDIFSDTYLIKAHNKYQSNGIPALKISKKRYNKMITSLSLVNKYNLDPEVQLADLLGATARLRYRVKKLKSKEKISRVEKNKLKLIERKLKNKTAKFEVLL